MKKNPLISVVQQQICEKTTTEGTKLAAADAVVWTCDTCKVTLESEKAFKSHRRSHVKCSSCEYEGAPKLVKAHFLAVHGKFSGSGFKTITVAIPGCRAAKYKICVGNRPEDIQRWIAERKKRFPRTDIIATATTTNSTDSTTSSNNNNNNNNPQTAEIRHGKENKETAATGLSSLLAGYGSSSDESDSNNNKDEDSNDKTCPRSSTTINSQIGASGGSSPPTHNNPQSSTQTKNMELVEGEDDVVVVVPTTTTTTEKNQTVITHQQRTPSRPCRFFFRQGSCRNGENCRFSHVVETGQNQQQQHSRNRKTPSATNSGSKNINKKRKRGGITSSDTLLRRLLENDMERESTLTMQLLKYIVDSNFFFDKDKSKGNSGSKNSTIETA